MYKTKTMSKSYSMSKSNMGMKKSDMGLKNVRFGYKQNAKLLAVNPKKTY